MQYEGIWENVMPVGDVTAVVDLNEKSNFGAVSDELLNIVESSLLGDKMFGWATKYVLNDLISKILHEETEKFAQKESISVGEFTEFVQKTVAKVQDIKGVQDLPDKRTVVVSYRGWEMETSVSSLAQQVETQLMIAVRGWAVEAGMLDALPGERTLCDSKDSNKTIEEKLVLQARSCRAFCSKVLKSDACTSGEEAEVLGVSAKAVSAGWVHQKKW